MSSPAVAQFVARPYQRCLCCGRSLEGRRRDARYWGSSCRAEASRLRAQATLERVMARHSQLRRCEVCGGSLAGRRADARFCTAACRSEGYRRERREELTNRTGGVPGRVSENKRTKPYASANAGAPVGCLGPALCAGPTSIGREFPDAVPWR